MDLLKHSLENVTGFSLTVWNSWSEPFYFRNQRFGAIHNFCPSTFSFKCFPEKKDPAFAEIARWAFLNIFLKMVPDVRKGLKWLVRTSYFRNDRFGGIRHYWQMNPFFNTGSVLSKKVISKIRILFFYFCCIIYTLLDSYDVWFQAIFVGVFWRDLLSKPP